MSNDKAQGRRHAVTPVSRDLGFRPLSAFVARYAGDRKSDHWTLAKIHEEVSVLHNMRFPEISKINPLILASSSPRRKRLLSQVGLPFRSVASQIQEKDKADEPKRLSRRLSEKKAYEVHARIGEKWILGADTLVVVDDKKLGKPKSVEAATRMLSLLSGREHEVITGFCILDPSGQMSHSQVVTTRVRFKRLSREEIEAYILSGEPFGKAGSYAIQGIGAFMVEGISGSYTNVVGLPLCAVVQGLLFTRALSTFPLQPPLANDL